MNSIQNPNRTKRLINMTLRLKFAVTCALAVSLAGACVKTPVVVTDHESGGVSKDTSSRATAKDSVITGTVNKGPVIDLTALRAKADSLYAQGLYDDAMPVWMKLIEHAAGNKELLSEAHYFLANIFYNKTEYNKAELEFKLALREDSTFIDAYQDLGLVYIVKGDYDKAMNSFKRILEFLPADSEATEWLRYTQGIQAYDKGLEHYNYGFYDQAIGQFKIAVENLENDTAYNYLTQFLLGKSYYEKLDYESAQKHLEISRSMKPESAPVYTELANISFAKRDFRKAIEYNKKAIELKPDFAKAYNNLGYIYMTLGNEKTIQKKKSEADDYYRLATQQIEKALALDPAMAGARNNLEHIKRIISGKRDVTAYTMFQNATKLEKNTDRIKKFRQIISADSTYDDAYNNLGVAYFYEGHADSGIAMLERAIDINRYNPQAHNNLGYMLGASHKFEDAIKHLFIAIQIKPDYIDAYVNLGYVYMWKQDFQNSRKVWLTLLKLNPNNKEARKGYDELQKREQAAKTGETNLRIEYEEADSDSVNQSKK